MTGRKAERRKSPENTQPWGDRGRDCDCDVTVDGSLSLSLAPSYKNCRPGAQVESSRAATSPCRQEPLGCSRKMTMPWRSCASLCTQWSGADQWWAKMLLDSRTAQPSPCSGHAIRLRHDSPASRAPMLGCAAFAGPFNCLDRFLQKLRRHLPQTCYSGQTIFVLTLCRALASQWYVS
jgi:hypothetical protein